MVNLLISQEQFLQKLTETIEANFESEKFGVSELATELGMSRVVLYRKIKQATNKSVSRYITKIRLKKAFELLQNNRNKVTKVAYEVGFGSPSYFIKCFHDQYGYTPGELLKANQQVEKENITGNRKKRIPSAALLLMILIIASALYFIFIYTLN